MLFLLFFPGKDAASWSFLWTEPGEPFPFKAVRQEKLITCWLQSFMVSEEAVLIKVSAMRAFDCD